MTKHRRIDGLVAAVFTPMNDDCTLSLERVPALVDHLLGVSISGLFVCGSTGEGVSLTSQERRAVAEAYVRAAAGRLPVIVHVGHDCLEESGDLAAHSQSIGADAIACTPTVLFKPHSTEILVEGLRGVAERAPDLGFFYYHIPSLTGTTPDMLDFCDQATRTIESFAGVKFSQPDLATLRECLDRFGEEIDFLFGVDEMLLGALAIGVKGAVGSTYNFLAPLYHRVISCFESGDMDGARDAQGTIARIVRVIVGFRDQAGLKGTMRLLDGGRVDPGPNRLPNRALDAEELDALRSALEELGFFDLVKS